MVTITLSDDSQASAVPRFSGTFTVETSEGTTSYPSFFMSFITTLKDTVTKPWERTLVTEIKHDHGKLDQTCKAFQSLALVTGIKWTFGFAA